jgi:hypothetical protein
MTRKYQIRSDGKRKRVSAKADKRISDIAKMALKKQKAPSSSAFDPRLASPLPSRSKSSKGGVGKVPVVAATTSLPLNLLNSSGSVLEDYEDASEWTETNGGGTDDSTNFFSGTQGVKLDKGVDSRCDLDKDVTWDLSTGDYFRWYIHLPAAPSGAPESNALIATDSGFSKYWTATIGGNAGLRGSGHVHPFAKADLVATGGIVFSDAIGHVRMRANGGAGILTQDYFAFGFDPVPAVCIVFDDSHSSHYDLVLSEFTSRNMVGTVAVMTNLVGTDDEVYLTVAEVQEMGAADWIMANHSIDTGQLTDDGDNGSAALAEAKADLDGWGVTGGEYVIYPNGAYNADVLGVMTTLEMKFGGTTKEVLMTSPPVDNLQYHRYVVQAADSLQDAKDIIDDAIAKGAIAILSFHDIVESGASGNDWLLSDLQELLDYIVDQGVDHLTIKDLIDIQSGSISVLTPGG